MLFGVSKNENIVINRVETRGDKAKIDALLDYIKVKDKVEISSYARLGKVSDANEGDKKRPIKIVLKNSDMAVLIMSNAKLLRKLNQKLFFKPDKTVKEREEFQRLLKKKNEYTLSHPTADGDEERESFLRKEN